MFNTDNARNHDPDILQMGLVVSDADVEAEAAPQLHYLLNLHLRSGHNDPVPFILGSSLPSMNANHGRVNHLEPIPVVTRRLLQSTNIPINRISMNNNNPTGCREINYVMLHVLATMANLSSHLLRYDDVVSAQGDGNLVEDVHILTIQ